MQDPHTYAWNWFALHSSQRLQLVNFWLVAVAFLAAAYVQARSDHLFAISLGVSVASAIASLAFAKLDARTRELVQVAERSLRVLETDASSEEAGEPFQLIKASELARRSPFDSYRVIIECLQFSVALLFILGAIYSIAHP
jgi:hypothetical protein